MLINKDSIFDLKIGKRDSDLCHSFLVVKDLLKVNDFLLLWSCFI
jgi:hypothetical protein